jgi:hypothetical protein
MRWYTIRCSEPVKLAIVAVAQAAERSERYVLEQLAEYGLPEIRRRLVAGNGRDVEVSHALARESPAESITEPGGVAARRPAGQKRGRR